MTDIILATINAKYIHSSLGLRYIYAALNELRPRASLHEFNTRQSTADICETLLREKPLIVGLGVYVWNAGQSVELVRTLKAAAPEIVVVLGGPEVSHETEPQEITGLADYVICGEGELEFRRLAQLILNRTPPAQKIIPAEMLDLKTLTLPYSYYSDEDIRNRIVYVEASRGCPFECEFCLSSLDRRVREFDLERLLPAFETLLERGLKHFKFVDRTFNLDLAASTRILQFFQARLRPGLFLHFEMVPDRFPETLKELIRAFPPGSLQFEIGIQTLNPSTQTLIGRKQDQEKTFQNLKFLREETSVHLHTDLIAGLPGESLESFAAGFDTLLSFRPHEIQVGILKRLRGAPIAKHSEEHRMVYNSEPPYVLLRNRLLDFAATQKLQRFSRFWDLLVNSGNFLSSSVLIWQDAASPFAAFLAFSEWLYARTETTWGISLNCLAEALFDYLNEGHPLNKSEIAGHIRDDYARCSRKDLPRRIRKAAGACSLESTSPAPLHGLARQRRHSVCP
jgi:hypothetical protein